LRCQNCTAVLLRWQLAQRISHFAISSQILFQLSR